MGFAQAANLIKNPAALAKFFGFSPIILGNIVVDVLVSETPVYDYQVTEHPVEAGLDITDNRVKLPTGLILECIFTDIPFDPRAIAAATQAAIQLQSFPLLTWQDKYTALLDLAEKNDIITVYTPLNAYFNMMITSLRMSQNKDTANAAFLTVEMREIRTVASEINIIDSSQLPTKVKELETEDNSNAQKTQGKQTNKGAAAPTETTEKNNSVAYDTLGSSL
jgi:hypothetical protein